MFLEKFLKMQDDSVENELRKQAEKKGLDYEMVRNDAELGVYLGVAAFGSYFGLIRSKERPLLIDYDDLFWIYKDNDDDKHTNLIFYFTDGEGFSIRSSSRTPAGTTSCRPIPISSILPRSRPSLPPNTPWPRSLS